MLYFTNTELAESHQVTLSTVLNWVQAAKNGKLDLDLHTEKGKTYVANTVKNMVAIEGLVERRRKYRNAKAVKSITPRPEFYKLYNEEQVYDIASSLEIYREIPRQYNYFDGGAALWEKYAQRLASEKVPNTLNSTLKLLESNRSYIDSLLERYKQVNVVDIGVGNALPVKGLLTHLLAQGKLGRYIALDISPDMLNLARRNIRLWFGDRVTFEGHERDINYDRFVALLIEEYSKRGAKDTVNLILLLGGTLHNFRSPDGAFRIIHNSMGMRDLLLHSVKLDTEVSRRYFDFNLEPGNTAFSPNHRLVADMLNIDESFYRVEMGYDARVHQRYVRLRLKLDLTLKFCFSKGERIVELSKGDTILVWRNWQQTATDVMQQFDRNDFYMLHSSQTEDQEYMLTVSRVKREDGTLV